MTQQADGMATRDRRWSRLIGVVLPVALLALLAGCTPSHPQSTFDTLGPVARSQATLFYVIFWVGLAVFILVTGALIYAAIRYRRRPGDGDPEQIHGHTRLEIVWTIVPAIVLAIVAVPSVITIFDNANSPKTAQEGGLVVDVIGHQWWFEFRYSDPDNDGRQIVLANELHIPVAEPVNLNLDSIDVIHSFWIPKIAGKVDMVPNNANTIWIQADEPGDYYGQCAEFCGRSHALMRFRVIAHPRAEFDAWLRDQAAPAVEPAEPLGSAGLGPVYVHSCRMSWLPYHRRHESKRYDRTESDSLRQPHPIRRQYYGEYAGKPASLARRPQQDEAGQHDGAGRRGVQHG